MMLTDQQWQSYEAQGYLHLGQVATDDQFAELQREIDDVMLGKADVDYQRIYMQRDSQTGAYEDIGESGFGFLGASLDYRKVQGLEYDRAFLTYALHPLFEHVCRRVYGPDVPIRSFRAMFMNKPAGRGTVLPWHQDRWTHIDLDPLVTIWTALDDTSIANGCVQIIPASHKTLVNPDHAWGFLTDEQQAAIDDNDAVDVELKAGEAMLLHNWLLHRSGVNSTNGPRRGFSVCYMDGNTKQMTDADPAQCHWPVLFGDGALRPENLSVAGPRGAGRTSVRGRARRGAAQGP